MRQSDLVENFYNRVWLIPGRLDLGNVVSVQERLKLGLNAHFTPRTLSRIDREDADGISLAAKPAVSAVAVRGAAGAGLDCCGADGWTAGSGRAHRLATAGRTAVDPGHYWKPDHLADAGTGLG
ncbi:hypothetical protein PUL39_030475 [Pseudomonas aeruginosa]|uniref:hypothetical protein n=1 Tax=Pseudomonas aeruginosa TaxID=287 RepID=UPI0023B13D8B|nr:hypothetical protein [Pseudomonas aeruginosa]MDE8660771.1 hypothetical protein [Pseudomonas aeruginosa]